MGLFLLPHIEPSLKRVRVFFGGRHIIDTQNAKLVWEIPAYPTYFFQEDDLPSKFLTNRDESNPRQTNWDVVVGSRCAEKALKCYPHTEKDLGGLFTVDFSAMDAWFEEEEQIFVHPKNPFARVDVLQSSRHVCVSMDGLELANTHMPRLLFETGLQVRTYIPKNHCRLELLEPSELRTHCPYKGEANYYHVVGPLTGERRSNVAWWYENPSAECFAIKGYVAFHDEVVDMWVDGEHQAKD